MAEKNFKITGGLALGDYALTANALALLWDGNALATQSYVDGAAVGAGTGLYYDSTSLAVNTNVIASREYVDSVAQGLDVKASVKLATTDSIATEYDNGTGQLTISSGVALIDGVSFAVGDRILVKHETTTTSASNGIYVVTAYDTVNPTIFTRANDANELGVDLNSGAFVFVESGDTQAGKGFVANVGPDSYGFRDVVWSQFSAAAALTAGTGIYLESGAINVNVNAIAGTGLVSSSGTLALDQYAAGVRYNGTLGDGGNASVTSDTFYATVGMSDTYITVANFNGNKAFTFDVFMSMGSSARKSTVSGIADAAGNVEYTEYAIVDSATPITSPDIAIEHNDGQFAIRAKASDLNGNTLYIIVESTMISRVF